MALINRRSGRRSCSIQQCKQLFFGYFIIKLKLSFVLKQNAGIRMLDASGSVVWRSPLSNAVSPGTPFQYIIRDNGVPAVLDANDRLLWQPTGASFAMNGRQCRWGKTSRTRRIKQGEPPLTVGQYLVTSYDYRLIVVEREFCFCYYFKFILFF